MMMARRKYLEVAMADIDYRGYNIIIYAVLPVQSTTPDTGR